MAKLLGIDYGQKRIGVAVGDTALRLALPLTMIDGRNDPTRDARAVADLAKSESVDELVVGLPLNMDGTDSAQTATSRRFAAELARLSGKPVHLHDERLSSFAASESLDAAGIKPRRQRGLVDRIAAKHILQAWLDANRPPDAADPAQSG